MEYFDGDHLRDEVTIESFKGKVVILEFWATWCKPCIASMPYLKSLADSLKEEPFVFISITDEEPERVEYLMGKNNWQLPGQLAIDQGGETSRRYAAMPLPVLYVINANGELVSTTNQAELLNTDMLRNVYKGKEVTTDAIKREGNPDWDIKSVNMAKEDGVDTYFKLEPIEQISVFRVATDEGYIRGEGLPLNQIIPWLLDVPGWNYEHKLNQNSDDQWRFALYAKDQSVEELKTTLLYILATKFDFRLEENWVDKEVVVLEKVSEPDSRFFGKSTSEKQSGKWLMDAFDFEHIDFDELASLLMAVGLFDGKHVINDTGISGPVYIKVKWIPRDKDSIDEVLAQCGLSFTIQKRPVKISSVVPNKLPTNR